MKAAKTAVPIDHHADANLKRMQPPMTSFFSPFAALTASRCDQGTDTQSQKKLAPSVLQEKPTKIVATFRKRPRLLLKGTKGDNLPITNAAFKERGIDIQTVLSIAEHQASLYSSEEEDSLCLSHLVTSVKPKKEKKRKNLKDVSAMENRIRAKSAHAVSTESTNLLEEPVSVMKGTLPMLNDFGVWKALVGRSDHFTKCTRSVKHVAKQRVLKDPPYRNILKTETDHNKQSKRKKDELKKKPLPAEDLEKLICELPLEGFAERNKMEPNAYFPSLDGVPKGLEREKKCADAARPRKAHLGFSRNIAQALLDRSIYGRTAKLRPAIVTTEHQAESVNGNETTDENELVYNNESSQYNEMVDNSNEVKLSRTRIPWSHPSWLSLVQHSGSGSGKCTVTKMAWDRLGVLLAVAYEGSAVSSGNPVVAIYDWDMVAAADRRGRSHRQRQLCEECADVKEVAVEQVEPFMTIPIPSTSRTPVILLEWNPFRPDELVVGLRSLGSVFIFDLDAVRAWLERYVHGARTGLPLPPCRELRCLEGGSCGFSDNLGRIVLNHNSAFCFLDNGNHAILSGGSALFCWYTGGGNWVPGVINLLWKFQYKDTITSMSVLTADTIVLGSSTGLLAILNWKKVVRASFSCKPSPTLVEDWVSFSAGPLQEQFDTPSPTAAMGILKIHVIAESTIPGEISLYRLVCVTSCGWVLSSVIEALSPCTDSKLACASEIRIRRRKGCELHHSTKPIKWKEIGGDVVSLKTRTWVVPTKRIQVHNTEMALIWQKVEDDTVHVLPHPDQRVLASAPSLAMPRCMNSTLEWMATSYSSCGVGSERYHLRTIPIPKNAGPLTCIAVHPDQEWILVGTSQTGISLINARSNIF